jgi:hypothetical protein
MRGLVVRYFSRILATRSETGLSTNILDPPQVQALLSPHWASLPAHLTFYSEFKIGDRLELPLFKMIPKPEMEGRIGVILA